MNKLVLSFITKYLNSHPEERAIIQAMLDEGIMEDSDSPHMEERAVWSTAYINDLPDSAFLHILPGGEKDSKGKTTPRSLRMFPYKDSGGNVDLPHLRNAIARIPQSNRIDQSTKERLQNKARKLLDGVSEKSFDTATRFLKGADGNWWFIGIYSNKFEDRQDTILSSESHERFSDFVEKSGFKPVVTLWHEPNMSAKFWLAVWKTFGNDIPRLQKMVDFVYRTTAFAKAEKVFYLNGFALVVAKVLPGKEAIAEKLSGMKDLGMSHGFLAGDITDNIIDRYFSFEFTCLPRSRAANYATLSSVELKGDSEMPTMDGEKRKFLADILGEEIVQDLEAGTKDLEKALEPLLLYKELIEEKMGDEKQVVEETPVEVVAETEAPVEEETSDAPAPVEEPVTMAQVLEFMTPLKDVLEKMATDLSTVVEENKKQAETISALTREIGELKQTDDQKIAEAISPQNFWSMKGFSATQQGNVVEKKEEELPAPQAPGAEVRQIGQNAFADLVFMGLTTPQGSTR